jgi:titin
VPLTSPPRRALGLLAAGTIGLSTTLLGVAGIAHAVPGDTGTEVAAAAPLLAPTAPVDVTVDWVMDGGVNLLFQPGPFDPAVHAATTDYEVSTDDGATWGGLVIHSQPGVGIYGTLENLTNGQTYPTKVRATSAAGAGAPSAKVDVIPAKPNGTPGGVTVTAAPGKVTASWSAPTVAGTFPVAGYRAFLYVPAEEDGSGGTYADLCETTAAVLTCTGDALPRADWQLGVYAIDSHGNMGDLSEPVATGVVLPAPTVPESDGPLSPGAGSSDKVEAGKTMTITGSGYEAGSTVTLLIYSEPQVLTTVVADGSGNFTATVTVPAGLAAGQHTLVAAGVDRFGNTRYTTLAVTVSAPGAATLVTSAAPKLAATGADVGLPLAAGLVTLAVGAGLIVASRRRSAT